MATSKAPVVRLRVQTIETDPIEFKPYKPTYAGDELYVDIPIDAADVKVMSDGKTVLTMNGFQTILTNLTNLIEATEDARKAKFLRTTKPKSTRRVTR